MASVHQAREARGVTGRLHLQGHWALGQNQAGLHEFAFLEIDGNRFPSERGSVDGSLSTQKDAIRRDELPTPNLDVVALQEQCGGHEFRAIRLRNSNRPGRCHGANRDDPETGGLDPIDSTCLSRKPVQPALHGRSGLIHRFLLHVLRNSDQGDYQKRLGPFTENGRTDRGEGGEHLEVHRTVDDARPCLAGHLEATDDHRSGCEDLNRNRLEQSRFSPSEDGEHK